MTPKEHRRYAQTMHLYQSTKLVPLRPQSLHVIQQPRTIGMFGAFNMDRCADSPSIGSLAITFQKLSRIQLDYGPTATESIVPPNR